MVEESGKKKATAGAIVLWLITVVLSVLCLLAVRNMTLNILARFGLGSLLIIGNYIAFPMLVFCIAVIIGGFEYHFRRAGQAESWRIFVKTLAIEIGILLLATFVNT